MKDSIFYYDKLGNVFTLSKEFKDFENELDFGITKLQIKIINQPSRPPRVAGPLDFDKKYKLLPQDIEMVLVENYARIISLGYPLKFKGKKLFFELAKETIEINKETDWLGIFTKQFKLDKEKRSKSLFEEMISEVKEEKQKEEKKPKNSKYGQLLNPEEGPLFKSISLPDATLETINVFLEQYEIRDFLKDHGVNRDLTVLNFFGPPGTGKTLCASALGKKLGKPLMKVKYEQVESKYIGETEKNLKKMFDEAQELDAILFLDEADSLLSTRINDPSSSTENYMNQSRNVFMQLLDSFKGIVVLTTNLHINYDPAIASRISKNVHFKLPTEEARAEIIKIHLKSKTKIANKVKTLKEVAKITKGFSGRDLKIMTEETIIKAAANWHKNKKGAFTLTLKDFQEEIDRINMSKNENNKQAKVVSL